MLCWNGQALRSRVEENLSCLQLVPGTGVWRVLWGGFTGPQVHLVGLCFVFYPAVRPVDYFMFCQASGLSKKASVGQRGYSLVHGKHLLQGNHQQEWHPITSAVCDTGGSLFNMLERIQGGHGPELQCRVAGKPIHHR